MLLSEFHPYPVFMPQSDVTDEELRKIPLSGGVRLSIEQMLRVKRAPVTYHELVRIREDIQTRWKDAVGRVALEHHIAQRKINEQWQHVATVVDTQIIGQLHSVKLNPDEVNRLLVRWLLLHFGEQPDPEQVIEGRHFKGGIMQPTAGRK